MAQLASRTAAVSAPETGAGGRLSPTYPAVVAHTTSTATQGGCGSSGGWTAVVAEAGANKSLQQLRGVLYDKAYIYCLSDPRDGQVRYVGKTICLNRRFNGHLHGKGTHKANWIQELVRLGLKPVMEVLEEVPANDWEDAEKFWIASLSFMGCKLTNGTEGGEGGGTKRGYKQNPEHSRKIAAALHGKKKSPEHVASMLAKAAMRRGVKRTNESRLKQIETVKARGLSQKSLAALAKGWGRKQTPEEIAKRAASCTGKKRSPESIARMKAAQKIRASNPVWRAQHSAALMGRKQDPASIVKMVATQKANREARRILKQEEFSI